VLRKFFEINKQHISFFNLGNPSNLEDTVRNLREENAKLLQLLRSRKYSDYYSNQ